MCDKWSKNHTLEIEFEINKLLIIIYVKETIRSKESAHSI